MINKQLFRNQWKKDLKIKIDQNECDWNRCKCIKTHPSAENDSFFLSRFLSPNLPCFLPIFLPSNLQYDLSASQFSPDGRVFQVEYANKAVDNSGTVVALRGKDGVVFAVEKLVTSKLYESGANRRLFTIDKHVGVAVAGLYTDAKAVVEQGREEARNYR